MATSKKPSDKGIEYTTFRIFAEDGEDLAELAAKRNKSIAALYRELFAGQVRDLLKKAIKDRLQRLENRD